MDDAKRFTRHVGLIYNYLKPSLCIVISADPRLLGALRRMGAGCNAFVCFTLSRIALAESTHLFRGSVCFQLFFSRAIDCTTFTLHGLTDFYVEIKRNDHSLAKLKNETKM